MIDHSCNLTTVDCWNGDDGEPIIYHGHTLTSKVSFQDVCQTIAEYSFVVSEYPVILSLENHCDIKQQQRMAQIMVAVFGDMLPTAIAGLYPTPEKLRRKILLKGHAGAHDVIEFDANGVEQSKKQEVAPELSAIIFLPGTSFKGFENHSMSNAPPFDYAPSHTTDCVRRSCIQTLGDLFVR
jgi:hypothetical protein